MIKGGLVSSLAEILESAGFKVVDCIGSRSSFDLIAKREDLLLLVKVLANIEGLSRLRADELKTVSSILGATPLVVSERMKTSDLSDGVVYDRYGVSVFNPKTLEVIVNDGHPATYSKRGNYCVRVDGEMLADARRKLGYTQESLARELGISKQSIYRYEATGNVCLEVFERLSNIFGAGIIDSDFRLSHTSESEPTTHPSPNVTDFKMIVRGELENLGFKTTFTNAPFDMVSARNKRIFSVVSNDWRRLEDKLQMLEGVSEILGGYTLCISERRVKSSVSIMRPKELSEIKSAKELFKNLSK